MFFKYENALLHKIRPNFLPLSNDSNNKILLIKGMIGKKKVYKRDCCIKFNLNLNNSSKILVNNNTFINCLMKNIRSKYMDLSLILIFLSIILKFIYIIFFEL